MAAGALSVLIVVLGMMDLLAKIQVNIVFTVCSIMLRIVSQSSRAKVKGILISHITARIRRVLGSSGSWPQVLPRFIGRGESHGFFISEPFEFNPLFFALVQEFKDLGFGSTVQGKTVWTNRHRPPLDHGLAEKIPGFFLGPGPGGHTGSFQRRHWVSRSASWGRKSAALRLSMRLE